ncbi:MAG: Gldg family protein [Vicinamibacterales bacterium]
MKRIVGLLGWLGVVLVLAAVALRFTRSDLQSWSQGLAIAGLVVTGLYALTQWRDIARSFQGRNVRYGSITAGSVVLFLGILIGINWISNRQNKRWDLTAGGQFSVSDQTRQVVTALDKPVKVTVFHDTGADEVYRDKLDEYAYLSPEVSVEYVDANRDPARAQGAGVQALPTILFEYEGRTERTTAADEQSLTNALKKVVLGQAKKVYFLQGHGERDSSSSNPDGYSGITADLANDNFEVGTLSLAQTGKVPDDATVIVSAGPTADLLPGELDLIKGFLSRGGKLLLLFDPDTPDQRSSPASLIGLASQWGIKVGNDIVVDASGLGQMVGAGAETPVAMPVSHPITANFRLFTAFRLTRSVVPVEGGADGHVAQTFLESSPQSWAETDIKGLYASGQPKEDLDGGDSPGPISIAAAVSAAAPDAPASDSPDAPKPETRIAVYGDSDFATNRYIGVPGNGPIFMNTINWLAQQENLIAISPKAAENRPLVMTQDQQSLVRWLAMLIIPGLLFANAVRVWWRRR